MNDTDFLYIRCTFRQICILSGQNYDSRKSEDYLKKKKRKSHKPNSNRESMLGIREIYSLFLNNLQNFVTANCYNNQFAFFCW